MAGNRAYVEGIGLWSDRLPGWEAASGILRGEAAPPDAPQKRPSPTLLPANERRRAPDTVAVSLEVASKACAHAGCDPATLPSVFASTHGDLAITDYMCETLAQSPELISPTRFHNSVHNAAAGYWAIATGCTRPYTAVSASRYSFGNGLLEALVQMESDNTRVLFVAYDIASTGALATTVKSAGRLGFALILSPHRSDRSRCALGWKVVNMATADTADGSPHASLVAGNAMAAGLPLFEAMARSGGRTASALGPKLALELSVEIINQPVKRPAD